MEVFCKSVSNKTIANQKPERDDVLLVATSNDTISSRVDTWSFAHFYFLSLWKARCAARMDGTSFKVEDMIRTIKFLLNDASSNLKKFQQIRKNDRLVMESLRIPIAPIHKKQAVFIKWVLPKRGKVKLNVDGGACNNPGKAGGGGIIQD